MQNKVKGFTLMELLVVLIVSSILITLIALTFNNFVQNYYERKSLVNQSVIQLYEVSRQREKFLDKGFPFDHSSIVSSIDTIATSTEDASIKVVDSIAWEGINKYTYFLKSYSDQKHSVADSINQIYNSL